MDQAKKPIAKKPDTAKKDTAPKARVYDTKIRTYEDGTAMIIRKDMPSIVDKTDKAVEWLVANGFKADDIQILGEKPENWDICFGLIKEESPPKQDLVEAVAIALESNPSPETV